MSNLIRGYKKMSSFLLALVYALYILGIPRQVVTQELLKAHLDREATRAIERVMRCKAPHKIYREQLSPVKGFIYYKISKQNEQIDWVSSIVIK